MSMCVFIINMSGFISTFFSFSFSVAPVSTEVCPSVQFNTSHSRSQRNGWQTLNASFIDSIIATNSYNNKLLNCALYRIARSVTVCVRSVVLCVCVMLVSTYVRH